MKVLCSDRLSLDRSLATFPNLDLLFCSVFLPPLLICDSSPSFWLVRLFQMLLQGVEHLLQVLLGRSEGAVAMSERDSNDE